MRIFKRSKEKKYLKKLQLSTLYDISNIVSNEKLEKFGAAVECYSITKVINPYQIRRVKAHNSPSLFVKTLSKIDPTDKTTVITVENKFLTEGIDKDRNVFEIIITIKCKAKIYNKHQENALINICNLITNSLIVSNNISAISKFDLRVGEIRDLNQLSSKKVDVDVNEYTNDSDFVPIEVDDVSQQLALRDIEIIK